MTETMKRFLFNLMVIALMGFAHVTFAQNETSYPRNSEMRYFDENYQPISQEVFDQKKWDHGLLDLEGDSINHMILVHRVNRGTIEDRLALDSVLFLATKQEIDPHKPLVIIYYPGKDRCNSSGMATRKSTRRWYEILEKRTNNKAASNFVYLYKDSTGLYGRNDGYKSWHKDHRRIIENMFFKRHYPCYSFVVISEKGEYLSYFGGFPKDLIWEAVEALTD